MAKVAKYRPVLTAGQITHILAVVKKDYMGEDSIDHEQSLSVIATLSPFKAKIDNAGIVPTYITKPPKSDAILESIGGEVEDKPEIPATFDSKEAYWQYCYTKWQDSPANCTVAELLACKEHRYLNDLMVGSELAEFEKEGMIEIGESLL